MEEYMMKGRFFRMVVRWLCFITFGIVAFTYPQNRFNTFYLIFGALVGLIFGYLFRKFLKLFLSLLNSKLKAEKGKKVIFFAIDNGMMFLVPFAIMALIASFYLKWSLTFVFISAAIMSCGTAISLELGKIKGKQELKNTILTAGVAFLFSFTWTFSAKIMAKFPGLIEGAIYLVKSVMGNGGGSI